MKLVYKDPKKQKLQRVQLILVLLLLPIALMGAWNSYQDWSKFQRAEKLFQEASQLTHAGQIQEALPLLEECVEVYPQFYAAWEELAVNYHLLREFEKSRNTYEKAVTALPENGNLRRELATAYHYNEQHDKELQAAQIAVTLPNNDPLFTQKVLERAQKEARGEVESNVDHGALDRVAPSQDGTHNHQGHEH